MKMRGILHLESEGVLVEVWKEKGRYHAKINRKHTKALSDNKEDAIEQAIALFEACIKAKEAYQPRHSKPNLFQNKPP